MITLFCTECKRYHINREYVHPPKAKIPLLRKCKRIKEEFCPKCDSKRKSARLFLASRSTSACGIEAKEYQ